MIMKNIYKGIYSNIKKFYGSGIDIFKKNRYQTGNILLPGLDITVKLNGEQYFRNDGMLEDFNIHTDKIFQEFSATNPRPFDNSGYGRHISLSLKVNGHKNIKTSVIFIKDQDPVYNIFTQGHESTHAIISFGLERSLLTLLKSEGFNLNPFQTYNNEEEIANIGGLVAVYKKDLHHPCADHPELAKYFDDLMRSKS